MFTAFVIVWCAVMIVFGLAFLIVSESARDVAQGRAWADPEWIHTAVGEKFYRPSMLKRLGRRIFGDLDKNQKILTRASLRPRIKRPPGTARPQYIFTLPEMLFRSIHGLRIYWEAGLRPFRIRTPLFCICGPDEYRGKWSVSFIARWTIEDGGHLYIWNWN